MPTHPRSSGCGAWKTGHFAIRLGPLRLSFSFTSPLGKTLASLPGEASICLTALSPWKLKEGKDILPASPCHLGDQAGDGSASHLPQLPEENEKQEKGHAGQPPLHI